MSAATVAAPEGVGTRRTVDFWIDPACPLTRHTARWITQIADHVPLEVQ